LNTSLKVFRTYKLFDLGGRSEADNAVWVSSSLSSSITGIRLFVAQLIPSFAAVASRDLYSSLSVAALDGTEFRVDFRLAGG
jgi:hypothetical protein